MHRGGRADRSNGVPAERRVEVLLTEADLERLQATLVDMRDGLVVRLAERIDGGDLALLGSVGGALRVVDDLLREDKGDE
jgi:hypothetical protein